MIRLVRCAMAALILGCAAGAASAADVPAVAPAPPPPQDFYQPWQVRLRALGVVPTSGGSLSTTGGAFISNGFRANSTVVPELDISYFFTKNLAIEAICCLTKHNVYLSGGPLSGNRVASALLFPPTLLAQYHWTNFGAFQPYVGVGVNYTHYFSTQPDYFILNTVTIGDSWGVAGQVGFDYMIDEHWGFNVDVKKIMMNPRVTGTIAPGTASIIGRAALSPWLIGGGITFRFGGAAAPVVAKY
ncbi:OmpW family protein [Methylocella silvestris BL2]|uniref:OmpW family protein n=1 Tax=Methylocella silvestris (strain DSM 15510 / CIP 108128 / LMG 27833 / NCIMB 13906 / BL2) TaxID=395965 RepID=B8EID1_METSB|nr:OmpW family outer membrane protein [Methylocella silvestris]ACK51250.1 OmpW family protein [Methylocella silvestris BL2]